MLINVNIVCDEKRNPSKDSMMEIILRTTVLNDKACVRKHSLK